MLSNQQDRKLYYDLVLGTGPSTIHGNLFFVWSLLPSVPKGINHELKRKRISYGEFYPEEVVPWHGGRMGMRL